MTTLKSSLISLALFVGAAIGHAQVFQSVSVSSNNIPALSTNNVAGTSIPNGYISKQDLYYNVTSYSTNGNITLPVQSSPDGSTWAQISPTYLAAGTTNQINITLTTVGSGKYTNIYSGMVTIDTSHGQFYRIGSEINTGTTSGGGAGDVITSLNYYSQH